MTRPNRDVNGTMTATIARPRTDWLARLRTIMVLRPGQRVVQQPGLGVSASRRSVSSGSGNGLLNNLIAHWTLDETSGNRADSHGSNTLSPVNTPGYETGKISNATAFVRASAHGLTIASNAAVQSGDIDFSLACWVKLASKSATNNYIVAKGNGAATSWEYVLRYTTSTDRFQFFVAGTSAVVAANNFGAPAIGTWYFIVCQHNAAANTITIQVNNGTANSAADALIATNSHPFAVGCLETGGTFVTFGGAIDELSYWKRTLSADDCMALYNSGAGLAYTSFTT